MAGAADLHIILMGQLEQGGIVPGANVVLTGTRDHGQVDCCSILTHDEHTPYKARWENDSSAVLVCQSMQKAINQTRQAKIYGLRNCPPTA